MKAIRYLAAFDLRRFILWSAFLWYAMIATRYSVSDPAVWLRSLGIGVLVGAILTLNAVPGNGRIRDVGVWPTFRFFVIPFCVSSFSALTKGRAFFLIFPLNAKENVAAAGVIFLFGSGVYAARQLQRPVAVRPRAPDVETTVR